jgi:DNA (cytosine-5)-methyltransferase 1
MDSLVAVESFCGAGGMALGLIQAGFAVKYAFDSDTHAVTTYNKNIASHAEVNDVRQMTGSEILTRIGRERVDLFSGGPPCQGFSKQRRNASALADLRNELVRDYFRLVTETKARAFIFENVEIFGQLRGREFLEFANELLSEKYSLYRFFVSASDFGLAQTRGRFLLLGLDKDEHSLPPILSATRAKRTVRDIIGDMPAPPADYSEHPAYRHHAKARISALNEQRISFVPPGGGWHDIPNEYRLECHKNIDTAKGGWPDVYGRLSWDGQCPTVTAGFDNFSRGRFAHPSQDRAITLREGARLQGFPDSFVFAGTRHDVRKQIGNAVPPGLAFAAGEAIRRLLRKEFAFPTNPILPEESTEYGRRQQAA